MKKRNLVLTASAAAAVLVLTIGGTFAYLTDQTDTLTNVFASDVTLDGKIEETFDEEEALSYLPGEAITKIPVISLEDGSENAYVALKVECLDGQGMEVSMSEFQSKYGKIQSRQTDGTFADGYRSDAWTQIAVDGNASFYVYGTTANLTELKAGESTASIFDQVLVNTGIQEELSTQYKNTKIYEKQADGSYVEVSDTDEIVNTTSPLYIVDAQGNKVKTDVTSLPGFQINVTGYLVQSANNSAESAITELEKLAKVVEK